MHTLWFFEKEGRDEQPFSALRESAQPAWLDIVARLQSASAAALHR
jgi:hypothetical protein